MGTCPLIDYLAWLPFTMAVVAAASVAMAGVVRRNRAVAGKAMDVFAAVIIGASMLTAIAIPAVKGMC